MNKQKALSSFTEIKDRCENRRTKVVNLVSTTNENIFIVIFSDGSQANIDYATLEKLHQDLPQELFIFEVHNNHV